MKRQSILVLAILVLTATGTAWADLSNGLIAYYPFSGNANDGSGYGNNGTEYGATLAIDRFGNPDSAYSFDGVDDYIDCGSGTSTLFNSWDSFTLAAWIKHAESSTFDSIVARHDDRNGTFNYAIGVIDNKFVLIADQAYEDSRWLRSNTVLTDGLWYHVVGVYDNKNMTVYVNGREDGSDIFPVGGTGDSTASLYIGNTGYWSSYSDDRYFSGVIDGVRIYNRALTETEIAQLVPLPSAVILGSIGLTFSGWLLRRRKML
ncbi:MAG: LamG domain-containing protein [Planctomycetota bacterium]